MTTPPDAKPPSLDDFEQMARAAFDAFPALFREKARHVQVRIRDFAEDEILAEMGIDDPFSLSGLYIGIPLIDDSVSLPAPNPEVFLYRRPILDEWAARGDVALDHLIAHVLIHELGHHFGWSDDEMHAVLDQDDDAGPV